MKIYIYTDYQNGEESFESSRLRKNFKGFLEFQNIIYSIQAPIGFQCLAQYFTINDLTTLDLIEKRREIHTFLCLLYNESECDKGVFKKNSDGTFSIPKQTIEKINMYDYVICPSQLAKHYLIKEGVLSEIFVLNPGVKYSKFDLKHSYIKDIFYRMSGFNKDSVLATSLIREDDALALGKLMVIAKNFPNIKFVVLAKITNKKLYKKNVKKLKKNWKNICYLDILEEDMYNSLLYNADLFINVNSYFSNIVEIMEAMVSDTQIFALQGSVFEDVVIDKKNGYIYNDLSALVNGIKEYYSLKLPSLKEKAKEYAKNFSILTYGNELVKIYKAIEEVYKND